MQALHALSSTCAKPYISFHNIASPTCAKLRFPARELPDGLGAEVTAAYLAPRLNSSGKEAYSSYNVWLHGAPLV